MSETTAETATVEATTDVQDTEAETTEPIEGEEALGDPGKKALDLMKQRVKDAEKAARDARAKADALEQAAALKDKPAEEQALEAARAEARAQERAKANERILKSELRAAATGKLADPSDAALFINLADFDVSDDGDVDSDALADAIDQLIERKPHLAAVKQNRFDGAADQGAKRDSGVTQLTREQLADMTPEEIVQAEADGRLKSLLKTTT